MAIILTYRYRVKNRHPAELERMARAVNYVWNSLGGSLNRGKKP